jgi:hypothetical protein
LTDTVNPTTRRIIMEIKMLVEVLKVAHIGECAPEPNVKFGASNCSVETYVTDKELLASLHVGQKFAIVVTPVVDSDVGVTK